MLRSLILALSIAAVSGFVSSCSDDIPDCPSKLCVIAGGWKLVEVELDGESYGADLSEYRLVLHDPATITENSSLFERRSISGTEDEGVWSIQNVNPGSSTPFKGSVLRLAPNGGSQLQEDWDIESFTPRKMVLIIHRNTSVKDGPSTIRFTLERF